MDADVQPVYLLQARAYFTDEEHIPLLVTLGMEGWYILAGEPRESATGGSRKASLVLAGYHYLSPTKDFFNCK